MTLLELTFRSLAFVATSCFFGFKNSVWTSLTSCSKGEACTLFHLPAFTPVDTSRPLPPTPLPSAGSWLDPDPDALCPSWQPRNHSSQLSHEVCCDSISFLALFCFVFLRVISVGDLLIFLYIYHWFIPKSFLRFCESALCVVRCIFS